MATESRGNHGKPPPGAPSRPPAGSRPPRATGPFATNPTTAAGADLPAAAPPESDDSDGELTGMVVAGRYQILKKLGEGGMGTVYLAEHITIEKKVALKVLLHDYARKQDLKDRFLQEARAAAKIGHENIVDITDFGDTPDGSVFFAMEFLEGVDLSYLIRNQGPIPWARAKPILLQICRALGAAHSKGIIHRDMKPENIHLIEREGRTDFVKVLDFGIAKMSMEDRESHLTRTGMIFGTPEYMSPEQAQGNKPDHRVDIYAVGVIMYEMLTGRVPFKADTFMGILTKHIFEQPIPPSQMNPDVVIPNEAERIVLKAIAKEREERFQSMAEMAAAITSASGRVTRPTGDQSQLDPRIVTPIGRPMTVPSVDGGGGLRASSTGDLDLSPPRGRVPLIAGIVLAALVVAGAAGGYVWMRRGEKPVAAGSGSALVGGTGSGSTLAGTPDARAKASLAMHEITVKSTPPGAAVFKGEQRLGETPAVLKFARSDRKLLLTLKLKGYREGTLTFTPGGERSEEVVELQKEQPAEAVPVRPKIAKPEPRPKTKKAEARKPDPAVVRPPPKKKKKPDDPGGSDLMDPFSD